MDNLYIQDVNGIAFNTDSTIEDILEILSERLSKLESLAVMMLMDDFWELDKMILSNFSCSMLEFISQSIEINEFLFQKMKN